MKKILEKINFKINMIKKYIYIYIDKSLKNKRAYKS